MEQVCNMDCFNCQFSDCVNDGDCSLSERKETADRDKRVEKSRGYEYYPGTANLRQIPEIDRKAYLKAQRAYFHRKSYYADVEKSRQRGRENYAKHREARQVTMRAYASTHKEEISQNKRAYYLEHREEILQKRKDQYVPHPKEVIDTPEAQAKREREKARYEANKEEINRRRREKRRK